MSQTTAEVPLGMFVVSSAQIHRVIQLDWTSTVHFDAELLPIFGTRDGRAEFSVDVDLESVSIPQILHRIHRVR